MIAIWPVLVWFALILHINGENWLEDKRKMKKALIVAAVCAMLFVGATSAFAVDWVLMGSSVNDSQGRAYVTSLNGVYSVDFYKTFNFVTAPYMGGDYGPNHVFQSTAGQFDLVINNTNPVALNDRNSTGYVNGTGQWGVVDKTGFNSPIWGASTAGSVNIVNYGMVINMKSDGLLHWASKDYTTPFATDYQLRFESAGAGNPSIYNYNLYAAVPAAVPEPGTILAALTILGPAGLAFRRRRG